MIARELDIRDLDLRPFVHVEFGERRVVRLRDWLEGDLGVGVALVGVYRGDLVDRLLDRDRIEDRPRMHLGRRDYFVVVRVYRLHPVELDVGYLRALLHVVDQHVLTALLHDVRALIREESQPGNRLEVRSYGRRIERLSNLLRDVDANRVLFDALIADDINLGDYRRSLRARGGCGKHRGDHHCNQRTGCGQ